MNSETFKQIKINKEIEGCLKNVVFIITILNLPSFEDLITKVGCVTSPQ